MVTRRPRAWRAPEHGKRLVLEVGRHNVPVIVGVAQFGRKLSPRGKKARSFTHAHPTAIWPNTRLKDVQVEEHEQTSIAPASCTSSESCFLWPWVTLTFLSASE